MTASLGAQLLELTLDRTVGALSKLRNLAPTTDLTGTVSLVMREGGNVLESSQTFDRGVLKDWSGGIPDTADLSVECSPSAAESVLQGTDARRSPRLVLVRTEADLRRHIAVPPDYTMNLPSATCTLPGASAVVEILLTISPFGPHTVSMSFLNGDLSGLAFGGVVPAQTSFVTMTHANFVRFCSGRMSLHRCVEAGGDIRGDWPQLSLIAGLVEAPTTLRQLRGGWIDDEDSEILAQWLEATGDAKFRAVLRRQAATLAGYDEG